MPPTIDDYKDLLDSILEAEGWPAFTDDPDDPGGPTKGGITLKTLQGYWAPIERGIADLKMLPEEYAREIYFRQYVLAPHFDKITYGPLQRQVVNAGVLHGPRRSIQLLQEAVHVTRDGILGPITLAELEFEANEVVPLFVAMQCRYMARLVTDNYRDRQKQGMALHRDLSKFAAGWINRATEPLLAEFS